MWQRMENVMEHQIESDILRDEAAIMAARGNYGAAAALNVGSQIERMEAVGAAVNPYPQHHHHHHGGVAIVGAELAAMEIAREQQMMTGGCGVYGVQPGYYPPSVGYPVGGVIPPAQTTITSMSTSYPGSVIPGTAPYGPAGYVGPAGYPPAGPGYYPPY